MSKQNLRLLFIISAGLGLLLTTLLVLSAGPAAAQNHCQAPDVGDWVIVIDCTLEENQAAPEDVVVQDNAQLTIPDGLTLGVGFDSYNLRVQNGSRLVIQSGGRLATYRCPEVDPDLLNAPSRFNYNLTAGSLSSDFYGELASQGYRPHRLTGYRLENSARFATKWLRIGGPVRPSDVNMTAGVFSDRFDETLPESLAARGYRPIDVSGYNPSSGGTPRFADIWVPNNEGLDWAVYPDDNVVQLQARSPEGLVPVRVEAYQLGGETRFISLWVESDCKWNLAAGLERPDYQDLVSEYANTFRLVHQDQYIEEGVDLYTAIWWQRPPSDPGQDARVDLDWYLFNRFFNNNWCNGFTLNNFYATEQPAGIGGVRFGGIWTFDEPLNVTQTSPLSLKVQQEVNCAVGRAGAAIVSVNADTGEIEDEIYHHADQIYGWSSTSKIPILFSLLRSIDSNSVPITTTISVGGLYGTNGALNNAACVPSPTQACVPVNATICTAGATGLQASTSYGLRCLAQLMIRVSHNWATNRLIDYIIITAAGGILPPVNSNHQINQDMANVLGLPNTRVNRYMSGGTVLTGPTPTGPQAYQDGVDVTSTPREMVSLLMQVDENDGLLTTNSYNFFWNTLNLQSGSINGGVFLNGKGSIDNIFGAALNITPTITVDNKPGANCRGYTFYPNPATAPPGQDPNCANPTVNQPGDYDHRPQIADHLQRSEAGRLNLDNDGDGDIDTVVYYAVAINEADGPRPAGATPSQATIYCIGGHVAREYTGQADWTTDLTTQAPPCQSP